MRKGKTMDECLAGLDAEVQAIGDEAMRQASQAGRTPRKRKPRKPTLPSNVINIADYRKAR